MSRGQVGTIAVIRDPAAAVAAGKCWLARWNQGRVSKMLGVAKDSYHDRECGWCEYPTERLGQALDEFVRWAGITNLAASDKPTPMRAEIEMFMTLPKEEQQRLVQKAQGFASHDDDEDEAG